MSSVHSRRYQQFLRQLRAARSNAGLTQEQVAKAFKVPQSWVSKCESGERRVDAVELERFAQLYGKAIAFFLPEDEKP
jgi:transcriptional regulator with XRE-family HTH domain